MRSSALLLPAYPGPEFTEKMRFGKSERRLPHVLIRGGMRKKNHESCARKSAR